MIITHWQALITNLENPVILPPTQITIIPCQGKHNTMPWHYALLQPTGVMFTLIWVNYFLPELTLFLLHYWHYPTWLIQTLKAVMQLMEETENDGDRFGTANKKSVCRPTSCNNHYTFIETMPKFDAPPFS